MKHHRRERQELVSENLGDALPCLETALSSLLLALVKPDSVPIWSQVAARVYSTLKVWYSPEALQRKYFDILRSHSSSSSSDSGREDAEKAAIEIGQKLKRRHDAELLAAGLTRRQLGAAGGGEMSLPSIKVEPLSSSSVGMGSLDRQASTARVKREASLRSDMMMMMTPVTPAAPTASFGAAGTATGGNKSAAAAAAAAAAGEVKLEVKAEPGTVGGYTLDSLWTTPLPVDVLLELIDKAHTGAGEKMDHAMKVTFEHPPGPNVNVFQFGVAVGKQYREAVWRPTAFHTIRERVKSQGIRTLEQLYCAISQMMANCCVFNMPGGYYPELARNGLVRIVFAWSEYVATLEHIHH